MIRVIFHMRNTQYLGCQIEGHSGLAPSGSDILCAAVSALSQTAVIGLEAYAPGKFESEIRDNGFLRIQLHDAASEEVLHDSQIILRTLHLGLEAIASEYRKHIKIALQEVNRHD